MVDPLAKIVCGIDPGQKGGIAFVGDGTLEAYVLPNPEETEEIEELLKEIKPHIVFLEKAQSMPKQSSVGTFTYGIHYGALKKAVTSCKIPLVEIRPGIWTKKVHMGCNGDDAKEKSLAAARKLFPEFDFRAMGGKKPHDGMIDATLLAYWGAVFYGGK